MTLEIFFVYNHRKEIDETIKKACPNCTGIDDDERENWIMNDESLYNWALNKGVTDI